MIRPCYSDLGLICRIILKMEINSPKIGSSQKVVKYIGGKEGRVKD